MTLLASVSLLLLHPPVAGAAAALPSGAAAALPSGAALPELVVFDLDDTLWTPSLSRVSRTRRDVPQADKDVILYPEAKHVLTELATCARWRAAGTRVAVASRTRRARWAKALLGEFTVPVGAAPDRRSKALKARNPGQAKLRVLVDADDARAALERGARSSALAARAR